MGRRVGLDGSIEPAVSRAILGECKIISFVTTLDHRRAPEPSAALKGIAKCTGLPLGVPRAYFDQLGVFDLSSELSVI